MLTMLLVTVSVLIVSFIGLALFSFVAGFVSSLSQSSTHEVRDEPPITEARPVTQSLRPHSEGRALATGVVVNCIAYGALLLVFAGLILLLRSFGL